MAATEIDVRESLSLAVKERIAMDLEKYGTVRVVNIVEKKRLHAGERRGGGHKVDTL